MSSARGGESGLLSRPGVTHAERYSTRSPAVGVRLARSRCESRGRRRNTTAASAPGRSPQDLPEWRSTTDDEHHAGEPRHAHATPTAEGLRPPPAAPRPGPPRREDERGSATLDTHAIARTLTDAGADPKLADAITTAIREAADHGDHPRQRPPALLASGLRPRWLALSQLHHFSVTNSRMRAVVAAFTRMLAAVS